MIPEDQQVDRTRNALRRAPIALVLEWPYDSIRVRLSGGRANAGPSTFDRYFSSKDNVLLSRLEEPRLRATDLVNVFGVEDRVLGAPIAAGR